VSAPEFAGPQTALAAHNWGRAQTPRPVVRAYAQVKLAALTAAREADRNAGRPAWDDAAWGLLSGALIDIRDGLHDELFVVPLAQGGAGTSLNMNLNEAVAHLAAARGGRAHPIDDVNRYQSTNDTFATAVTILAYEGLVATEARVIRLQEELVRREKQWATQVMVGRTELQDALPVTLGQVFASWAGPFERDRWRLNKLRERVRTVPLGGTAVGTGFGAPSAYVFAAEKHLRAVTGLPLARSQNLVDEISHLDKFSELAGGLRQVAENLVHLTQDLLYYTSSAVGELGHPHLQAASSQMPAKTNPVALEYACGLAMSVQGEAFKVSQYVQAGRLQLNPYLPFVLESLLAMFDALDKALEAVTGRFLPGLLVHSDVLEAHLAGSPALLNALAPVLGYDRVSALSPALAADPVHSLADLRTLLVKELGLNAAEAEALVDPLALTQGRKESTR
jgi:aspartate ammonia-lyase